MDQRQHLVTWILVVVIPLWLSGCSKGTVSSKPADSRPNSSSGSNGSSGSNSSNGPSTPFTPFTPARSPELDSQFLIQATFGPTRASLAALQSGSLTDWIQAQMSLPVESHRAYYRARVNPRVGYDVPPGSPRNRCTLGSRWLQFAFSKRDKSKSIRVQSNKIYIDGKLRTDIDPSLTMNLLSPPNRSCTDVERGNVKCSRKHDQCYRNAWWTSASLCEQSCYNAGLGYRGLDCSRSWAGFVFQGYICGVQEGVASWVGLSNTSDCTVKQGMQNPAIWFADPSSLSVTSLQMKELTPGIVILSQTSAGCNLNEFIQSNGKVYMHDSRLELLQNTLDKPATTTSSASSCPNVQRTFLNEKSCKKVAACIPLHLRSAPVPLDAAGLKKFYDVQGKYLYEIVGLDITTSPCHTTSRWKRVTCAAGNCATAGLSTGDVSLVVGALQLQGGWLRDINVNCNSIPAKATVQVGSEFFENVHFQEHNVYDFSAWADVHPGGKSFITQWVNSGFQLTWRSDHPMTRWTAGSTQKQLTFVGKKDEVVDFELLPTDLQTPALAAAFSSAGATTYFQACGSPGEVANSPSFGHAAWFWYSYNSSRTKESDGIFDWPYHKWVDSGKMKTQIWAMKALEANDQLRQRMAWALSQIFVAGVPGSNNGEYTELWHNFYDIFVRNAFGSYRDVLREVTYSPVMGNYLTFRGSAAFDVSRNYPDENYAREIMQLFSIGLWKLHSDGTKVVDSNGHAVPTYSNKEIVSFARIFTGFDHQLPRGNLEATSNAHNLIDPMRMRAHRHDVYPKPDLDGGYIGDGFPLCADIPARAFLARGAEYSFLGYTYSGSYVKILSQSSGLYKALCGGSGSTCSFELNVKLGSDVACYNEECKMDTVEVVQVNNGYYELIPPTCVHLYFYNGQISSRGNKIKRLSHGRRSCDNPDIAMAGTSCCGTVNGVQQNVRLCGQPKERVRFSVAVSSCASLGLSVCDSYTGASACQYDSSQVWVPLTCQTQVQIHADGRISSRKTSKSSQNKITVRWLNGAPSVSSCPASCVGESLSCICNVSVTNMRVFDKVPTQQELKSSLNIGSLPPTSTCTTCTGEVKSYQIGGVIDENTIFENAGRYYKNIKSTVTVGGHEFRNPPVFMNADSPTLQAALAEVEALLDHLFHHPNTAVFISRLLIQRFGNSNPGKSYIRDVAAAFKSGAHNGKVYSGTYGDLGATVAAILLHPEARNPQSATQGALREPLLKVIHFLRSMEFTDVNHSVINFVNLDDVIGQEPFYSPSVFNFYEPSYQPAGLSGDIVAPEFQIFTAPWAVGMLNGLLSLVDHGMSSCSSGLGFSLKNRWYAPWTCNQGEYMVKDSGNLDNTLNELNLLLTGGRLASSLDTVRDAYNYAAAGDKFKAAQRAILLSPEFHTVGNSISIGTRSTIPLPPAARASGYKATVMLFMAGGADTFNMLVPYEGNLWSEYRAVRQNVALAPHELLGISTGGQQIGQFAIHHKFRFLRQLYNDGHAAFISNIGALVEPLTAAGFKSKTAKKCPGLFSHTDQSVAAATLECQKSSSLSKGTGGRIGDALKSKGLKTQSFSTAGISVWSEGFTTNQQVVHHGNVAFRLESYSQNSPLLKNITQHRYQNVYCEEYARSVLRHVESSENLANLLDSTTLKTSFTGKTHTSKQLRQVARLIAAREMRHAERDLFFVQVRGFDSHTNVAKALVEKFAEIDNALQEFVTELKAQNIFQSVVIASESDFGRTLSSNGLGTDHAWAGNQFVIGGKVNGGRVYNEFPPSLLEGNDQDLGRGRLIPKYPWENMMVPIAEWMGVEETQHSTVFPNLGNFERSKHILSKQTLFTG